MSLDLRRINYTKIIRGKFIIIFQISLKDTEYVKIPLAKIKKKYGNI